MSGQRWASFVAIGDSFTEGMADPAGDGGYRGWADRVAEVLAQRESGFRYANLAVRGRLFKAIVNEQVPAALAMRPELVSFVAGGNDALRPGFDLPKITRRLDWVIGRLSDNGATVLMLTAADLTFLLPAKRVIRERAEEFNEVIRQLAAKHGAALADLWSDHGFADRRMWGVDRLHLSPMGHRRAAAHALTALGGRLPGAVDPPPADRSLVRRRHHRQAPDPGGLPPGWHRLSVVARTGRISAAGCGCSRPPTCAPSRR